MTTVLVMGAVGLVVVRLLGVMVRLEAMRLVVMERLLMGLLLTHPPPPLRKMT